MRSRSNGGPATAQATTRSVRKSSNMAGAANDRSRGSVGQIKATTSPQKRPLPPKSEYEKFYENVFLGNDEEETEEEPNPNKREAPSAATKRPLHALLDDEDSATEARRPAKIPAVRKTSEVHAKHTTIRTTKDEVIRQINGPSTPAKRPVVSEAVKSIHQKRHDRFDQLYNKTERHTWKDDAIQMLLQFWAQHIKGLRGTMRNTIIYKEMEKQMSQFGPSHFEIKTKMDNMSRKYRVEADKYRETGVPSKWPYFHKIQSLLIGTKAVDVFEEMMYDTNTGSSKYFEPDESDGDEIESLRGESLAEETAAHDHIFDEDLEIKHDVEFEANDSSHKGSPSPGIPEAEEEEEDEADDIEEDEELEDQLIEREETPELERADHAKRKPGAKKSYSDRMLQIEEEKLAIEKEKLKVMREALHELSVFHSDLMKVLKHK